MTGIIIFIIRFSDYSFIYFHHYNMKEMERRKRKKMLVDVASVFIFLMKLDKMLIRC